MTERRTIGQILMSFGRITDDDVGRALEYQQKNGGYFGEALLALGYVSPEELEWGLAAQFDLPYVFPDIESIDPEAASLVSADWALTHLTLPIMRTADTLTVIVDSPIKTDAVDDLQSRTDRRIELALAPATKIRELIHQLYAGEAVQESDMPSVASLEEVFGWALRSGAPAFGISQRGPWAQGWYEDHGSIHRVTLHGRWREALNETLSPPPEEQVRGDEPRAWKGQLTVDGATCAVHVRHVSSSSGAEYAFSPDPMRARLLERFGPPPAALISEVRMLARSGAARFAVTADPEDVGTEMLPYFPSLLFDETWRSVHLQSPGIEVPDGVFTLVVDGSEPGGGMPLEEIRPFHLDVATVRLTGDPARWGSDVLDVAASAFVWWGDGDRGGAVQIGLRWGIHLDARNEGLVEWSLRPLRS